MSPETGFTPELHNKKLQSSKDKGAKKNNPDDPLGLFSDELETAESEGQAAATRELERKPALSLREVFRLIQNKLIDISPDFLISEDKLIRDFEERGRQSVDLSLAGGQLYDYLAQHALYKPNKEYTRVSREGRLTGFLKGDVELLKFHKLYPAGKSQRLSKIQEKIDSLTEPAEPRRYEQKKEGYTFQTFEQRVEQDGGSNVIEESVVNALHADYNDSWATLYIHHRPSGKTLELSQLLPGGYSFRPASLNEVKEEYTEDDKGLKKYISVPKNLNEYTGTQNQGRRFAEVGAAGKVEYGDLTKKGRALALLHEIAHAWQSVHHEDYGRYKFETFFQEITTKLVILDMDLQDLKNSQSEEEVQAYKNWISDKVESLKNQGVVVDPGRLIHQEGHHLESSQYKLTTIGPRFSRQTKKVTEHQFNFLVKTEKLKPLVEDYVAQERDAWAHALRVLRFFRRQGIDLEPELKTLKDVQEVVHYALGTYQTDIESHVDPTKDIRKFTRKNLFKDVLGG